MQLLTLAIPDPKSDLHFNSNFELLVAVLLSAHTTDIAVNKITAKLFPVANTSEKILALGKSKLKQYIKSIGLYNNKTENLLKTCEILVNNYHAKIPSTREELEALPGVGRKTANVILNIAFGQPTIAVDTHIFRVANRTKLAPGKTPRAVEEILYQVIPANFLHQAHHLLLLHGRYTCTARQPKCPTCVIRDLCEYENKT